MTLVHWSWILVILAVIDWLATTTLIRAALREKEAALEERATAALILTFAASLVAFLALAYVFNVTVTDGLGTAALIGALMLLSVPQLLWLAAYERGQFQ